MGVSASFACGLRRRAARSALSALLLVSAAAGSVQAQINLTAYLDRNAVSIGQAASLTIEVSGAQDVAAPVIPAQDGVTVRYIGPSTQVSFVNGQVSSAVSHRYSVTPSQEGTFTIGPFRVSHGGRDYETAALRLQAVAAEQAAKTLPGRDEIQLVLSAPLRRVYVQEPLPLTVTLYVGAARVEDLQYPTLPAEGFTMERFSEPKQTREVRSGRTVAVLRFDTTITPLRPGTTNIGPAHAAMTLMVPGRRNRDSFFDGFFGDYRREPLDVASEAIALEVLPLPEAGKPAGFQGAIGHFTMATTVGPTELRVGDPITVRTTIDGRGNWNAVAAPAFEGSADFKVYPSQEVASAGGQQKIFEQVLIPLRPDVRQVPAIRFSYFDTEKGRYETLSQGPFPLALRPAEEAQEARIVQGEEGGRAVPRPEQLGRDLVYIKDAPGTLVARGERFFHHAWFWAALLLPAGAYALLWLRVRRRERLRADPRYARFARAGREAAAALAQARQLLRNGEEARFDDALSRAARDYLGAKLDLPPGAIEAENVARRLGANGAGREVAERVERVLSMLEQARYAPSASARDERAEALRLTEEIVAALEKRRYGSGVGSAALALVAVALLGLGAARAADSPVASFYEGNALYGKGQFEEAARAYETILAAGQESAAVYYNLGNTYLKSGKPGRAILNYERARRLAPGDVDVQTNLRFAREEQKIEAEEPLWRRLALPLVERAGSSSLAAVSVALYAALLLALAARLLWPQVRTAAARAAVVAGLALLFVAANLVYRVARYDLAADAVVTHAGDTPVRFEPNPDGTTHFSVAEGTLLEVLEQRGDWLQIARTDGRRGWIEAAACEPLAERGSAVHGEP